MEHLKLLHKHVFPLFFLLCALAMVGFIAMRAGEKGGVLPEPGREPDRVGFLRAGWPVDPAFDLAGPVEMVLAPGAHCFGEPLAAPPALSGAGPDASRVVRAAADGLVVVASNGPEEGGVVLLHDRGDRVVETVYEGLASIRVGVGIAVRRGDPLGVVADRGGFRFRRVPLLGLEPVAGGDASVPEAWLVPADRLASPPTGEALEPGALKLQDAPAPAKAE